jgi:hypothetical protein
MYRSSRILLVAVFVLAGSACDLDLGGGETNNNTNSHTNGDPNGNSNSDSDGWPAHVTTIPLEDGATITGDLSEGAQIDLDFADNSSVACWPGTENVNFQGNHVIYALDTLFGAEDGRATVDFKVTPDSADTDVSIYAIQQHKESFVVPPETSSVVGCEAGYDAQNDSNPGEAEETPFPTVTVEKAYNVLVVVAGAEGHTSGGYTLEVIYERE